MATTQKKIKNPRQAIKKTKRVLHPIASHVSKPIVSKELTHKTNTTAARRDFFKSLLGYR